MSAFTAEDDQLQMRLGYKSELRRGITFTASVAMNFNAIAILMGIAIVFGDALVTGGPVVIVWGFLLAFVMTIIVSLSMAELCAAYPAAGGVYYWSAQLVPPKYAPSVSYFTAWSSLIGGVANVAISALVFSGLLNATVIITYGTAHEISTSSQAGIACVVMVVWACLNTARIDEFTSIVTAIGSLNFLTIVIVIFSCLTAPAKLNNAHDVFFRVYDETGFPSETYMAMVGIVFPAYCFAGYDASAQLAEETQNARRNAPLGIILANLFGGVAGFVLFVSLLAASVDIHQVVHGRTAYAVINVFDEYLEPGLARTLAWLITLDVFLQGPGAIGAASRTVYALARDNGLVFADTLAKVDKRFQSPIYAIVFSTCIGCLLLFFAFDPNSLQMLDSLIGLAVCGMQVSYLMPIASNLIFRPHIPSSIFSLKTLSVPFAVLSCVWLLSVSLLSFLPNEYPVTPSSMNWSVVSTTTFYLICLLNWVLHSQYLFTGPKLYSKPLSVGTMKESGVGVISPMQSATTGESEFFV